jgi:uncharacterized protein
MDMFRRAANNDLSYLEAHLTHLEMVDETYKSLLHHAVHGSAMDVILFLLDQDIDVNLVDIHGETALFDCARKGKLEIAKLLISKFAKVNMINRRGETAFHFAARKGNLNVLKLLVEAGSYTNKKTKDDHLPVHYAILAGKEDVIDYVLKVGEQSWFQKDIRGNTLLHYAARTQSRNMIERFLAQDLNPNDLNDQYETPLFNAIRFGTKETVQCLLERGAYIDISNRRFETPQDTARIHDKKELESFLIEYATKPEYVRLVAAQALTLAVLNRDHQALRERIAKGIPMRRDTWMKTALDYAKTYGLSLFVRLLRDVEINGKTTSGCRENANMI